MRATRNIKGEACRHYPACYSQSLLYKLRSIEIQAIAHRRERERCMARHMQACLVLRQFEYILNVTDYVNENYLQVKAKFLRAIDYVEDINVGEPTPTSSSSRHKRDSGTPFDTRMTLEETKYLAKLLTKLAAMGPHAKRHAQREAICTTLCFLGSCHWLYCECWPNQEDKEEYCYPARGYPLARPTN